MIDRYPKSVVKPRIETARSYASSQQQGVSDLDKRGVEPTVRRASPVRSQNRHNAHSQSKLRSDPGGVTPRAGKPFVERGGAQKGAESLNPRLLSSPPASHSFRLTVITKIHEQLVRLYSEHQKETPGLTLSDQDLIRLALDEEENVALENPIVYSNVVKLRIMALRRMSLDGWKTLVLVVVPTPAKETASEMKTPSKFETGLTPAQELAMLPRLRADMTRLIEHGYVTRPPKPAEIEEARKGVQAAQGWEKCERCKSRFQVFPGRREDGALTTGGCCSYHWGKPFARRDEIRNRADPVEKRYSCCNEQVGLTTGCKKADGHVFRVSEVKRMASVLQFIETPPAADVPRDRAVCLDCEMCYTVHGMELVRMTVTAWPSGDVVFDVLVRPIGEILNLNTRFSGVTAQQMATARPYNLDDASGSGSGSSLQIVSSPAVARALLLSYIGPETPIIGHALENDLGVLRLIHPYLVDSVLLFPHQLGLPYRNSLKNLARCHLDREIQEDAARADPAKALGHDSKEDAVVAGELVRSKIARDWKRLEQEGWSFDGKGVLTQPKVDPNAAAGSSSSAASSSQSPRSALQTPESPEREKSRLAGLKFQEAIKANLSRSAAAAKANDANPPAKDATNVHELEQTPKQTQEQTPNTLPKRKSNVLDENSDEGIAKTEMETETETSDVLDKIH